jgi:hypothetical protein
MHLLLIGPILIYLATYKEETPRSIYEIMLLLGFAALGYHSYYLIKNL